MDFCLKCKGNLLKYRINFDEYLQICSNLSCGDFDFKSNEKYLKNNLSHVVDGGGSVDVNENYVSQIEMTCKNEIEALNRILTKPFDTTTVQPSIQVQQNEEKAMANLETISTVRPTLQLQQRQIELNLADQSPVQPFIPQQEPPQSEILGPSTIGQQSIQSNLEPVINTFQPIQPQQQPKLDTPLLFDDLFFTDLDNLFPNTDLIEQQPLAQNEQHQQSEHISFYMDDSTSSSTASKSNSSIVITKLSQLQQQPVQPHPSLYYLDSCVTTNETTSTIITQSANILNNHNDDSQMTTLDNSNITDAYEPLPWEKPNKRASKTTQKRNAILNTSTVDNRPQFTKPLSGQITKANLLTNKSLLKEKGTALKNALIEQLQLSPSPQANKTTINFKQNTLFPSGSGSGGYKNLVLNVLKKKIV